MSGTRTIYEDLKELIGSNVLKLLYEEDRVLGLRVPLAVYYVYREYISSDKTKRKIFKETVARLILGLAKVRIEYSSFNQSPVIGPINVNIVENRVEAKAENKVAMNVVVNYRIMLGIVKEVKNDLKSLLEDTINNYLKVSHDPRERYRLNKIKADLQTILAKLDALPKN